MLDERDPERLRFTLTSILESAIDGVFVIDRDERVVIFNHACERLTGLRREEVVGSRLRCDDVFRCHRFERRGESPRDAEPATSRRLPVVQELPCALLDIFGARKPGSREETVLVSRTGERHWVETVFSPVHDEHGEVVYTVGILRVIDDRKRAEAEVREKNRALETALRELRERTRQLVHSEKMASIGQLAAGVAHELNTPLNTILGYSQLLRDQLRNVPLASPEQARARLEELQAELRTVEAATKRCRRIVRSLLSLSRPAEGQQLERDLGDIVRRVLAFLRHDIERRGVRLSLRIDAPAPVRADRHQIEQVLVNLVQNALDAMPEGGELTIALERTRREAPEGSPDWIRLRVADTGGGVPPELASRIFEPFFTTKPVGSGTGLGLPISLRIVEEHGGELRLASEPDAPGAVFELWLPAVATGASGAEAGAAAERGRERA